MLSETHHRILIADTTLSVIPPADPRTMVSAKNKDYGIVAIHSAVGWRREAAAEQVAETGKRSIIHLMHFITEKAVTVGVEQRQRDTILHDMVHMLADDDFQRRNPEADSTAILDLVISREKERTTATPEKIAFPHARIPGLQTSAVAISVTKEPVLFGDTETADIIVLVICPQDDPMFSLKAMATLSQFLMNEPNRIRVRNCRTAEELRTLLLEVDLEIDTPITARDIMRAPRWSVRHDMPATEIVRYMFKESVQTFPVLDDDGKIIGDITANRLFRFGLPDFFMQLKSVSFVSEFDPFENYFKAESRTFAKDLIADEVGIIPPEYTILEIVFDLAIRKYPKLYVVDKRGRWVGTIDHGTVLNNVINY